MHKIVSQDERHALPVDPKFALEVSQEMAEIDVKELRSKGGDGVQVHESLLNEMYTSHG